MPLYPEYTTVPAAAALIGVPVEFAISNPVCVPPDLLPNLDVIVPVTGSNKAIPKAVLSYETFLP